jgi:rhamnosyl/mannosyltransferase
MAKNSTVLEPFLEKARVVPIGIDLERLARVPEVDSRAAEIRNGAPRGLLLYVGPLDESRGIEYLLQAMIGLRSALVVIGTGPMEQKLVGMAEDLGVRDRVLFRGQVTDMEVVSHMHACDCLVLPSAGGPNFYGLAQLEAMACGKPIISTRPENGVSFVNMDGVTGYVVPPLDSSALAYRIKALLQDGSLCAQMGERARKRVEEAFSADRMVDSILGQYCDSLARQSAAFGRDSRSR